MATYEDQDRFMELTNGINKETNTLLLLRSSRYTLQTITTQEKVREITDKIDVLIVEAEQKLETLHAERFELRSKL